MLHGNAKELCRQRLGQAVEVNPAVFFEPLLVTGVDHERCDLSTADHLRPGATRVDSSNDRRIWPTLAGRLVRSRRLVSTDPTLTKISQRPWSVRARSHQSNNRSLEIGLAEGHLLLALLGDANG